MRFIISILIFTPFTLVAKANSDCIWTVTGKGITFSYLSSCETKSKKYLDSVFARLLDRTNRLDTTLQILVLINDASISYLGDKITGFKSIGIDTLRRIDNGFITNYYFAASKHSIQLNYGSNYFNSRLTPLDINATYNDTSNNVGVKIIYKDNYKVSDTSWLDIERLINYAIKSSNEIARRQRRDTVSFDYNNWYISLVTLDTFQINSIIEQGNLESKTITTQSHSNLVFVSLVLAGLIMTALFVCRRRISR